MREDEYPLLDPMSDVVADALLTSPGNEDILLSFINSVRRNAKVEEAVSVEVKNPFSAKDFAIEKELIMDVRATDDMDRIYDIEIQVKEHEAFNERMLNYGSDVFSSQLLRGEEYSELKPVWMIILSKFAYFLEILKVHCIFRLLEIDNPKIAFSRFFEVHVLKIYPLLKGDFSLLSNLDPELVGWLIFFAFGQRKDKKMSAILDEIISQYPMIHKASEQLDRLSTSEELRHLERRRKFFLCDKAQYIADAKKKARVEGREEGREEGRVEGENLNTLKIGRNMKIDGFDTATISRITGLSNEEIENLS